MIHLFRYGNHMALVDPIRDLHQAVHAQDWVKYDRAYAQTHDHCRGIIPLMVQLTELGQKERLRLLLAEYINNDMNCLSDLIKHIGWAAVSYNRYGILKLLLQLTMQCEPWRKNPDAIRFIYVVLWRGVTFSNASDTRILKMLQRAREAGYRFCDSDYAVYTTIIQSQTIREWVENVMWLELDPKG